MRVLAILAHPRSDSLCESLFQSVCTGIRQSGAELQTLELASLQFEPNVLTPNPADQFIEPDLQHAQQLIAWAEHLVWVYPTWWGVHPGLMKSFLDRVLTPGYAFRFHPDGTWDKLLAGRTSEVITTMDTPGWVYRWIYGSPGHRALNRATLGFCGIESLRVQRFGKVEQSTEHERQQWLAAAQRRGEQIGVDPRSTWQQVTGWLTPWLQALRLQFYPMTWIAYTLGALLADTRDVFSTAGYWWAYLCLFFLEAATVFSNDYYDYDSDRRNANAGPFNGGSRVLVDSLLDAGQLRRGIWAMLTAFGVSALMLFSAIPASFAVVAVLMVLTMLALGYTVPPLKLSHRGYGELDVGVTHGIGVVLFGYAVQTLNVADWRPWLASIPITLSVLPAIILSGVPDFDADRAAGKRTLVVRIGQARATWLAAALAVVAMICGLLVDQLAFRGQLYGVWGWAIVAHGAVLGAVIARRMLRGVTTPKLDGLMVIALSFIMWFGIVPLVRFW